MSIEAVGASHPGIGTKRVCVSCATRFYDLARVPAVCPHCSAEQPPVPPRAPPMRKGIRLRPMKAAAPVAEEDAVPVVESDDDEEADAETDGDEEEEAEADSEPEEAELA